MKRIKFLVFILFPILFIGCQEDFNPKTGIEEKYVLYGVYASGINASYLREVNLSRVYNIDGYDLSKFNVEPVLNAEVKVYARGRTNIFCESRTRSGAGASYIDTSYQIWVDPGDKISVIATLPNGKTLYADTYALYWNYVTYSYLLFNGFTTNINHFLWGNSFDLSWSSNKTNDLFFPSLSVTYSIKNDSSEAIYTKEIPMQYVKRNGILEPVYPAYQYQKSVSYDYKAIDSAIAGLAAGNTDKSKIKLYWLNVKLLEFNGDLSNYYSSIHGFTDRFSIRLDDKVYTNVHGGIGVFGATNTYDEKIYFNAAFAEMFGYDVFTDW